MPWRVPRPEMVRPETGLDVFGYTGRQVGCADWGPRHAPYRSTIMLTQQLGSAFFTGRDPTHGNGGGLPPLVVGRCRAAGRLMSRDCINDAGLPA